MEWIANFAQFNLHPCQRQVYAIGQQHLLYGKHMDMTKDIKTGSGGLCCHDARVSESIMTTDPEAGPSHNYTLTFYISPMNVLLCTSNANRAIEVSTRLHATPNIRPCGAL